MDWKRYTSVVAEYDAILSYAKEVSAALVGIVPSEQYRQYAEQIFVKMLAHCITLRLIAPDPARRTPAELWDLASLSAIARSIVETYDAMAYVALGEVEPDEREFRLLLWELHGASRRAKMLESIGSTDPRYLEILATGTSLRERAIALPFFARTSKTVQKKVEDGDPPPFHLSQRERCVAYRVNFDYYNAATMQSSQYVHTLPLSIHQLFEFKAGTPEALHMMSLPLQHTLAFLSREIEGIRSLFPEVDTAPSASVDTSIKVWSGVLERGVKSDA